MFLDYTLTRREVKVAAHAAVMAAPFPGWRAVRWCIIMFSLTTFLAALVELLRGVDHAGSLIFCAAYLCLFLLQLSERWLTGILGKRLPSESRNRLSLDEHGLSYCTPLGEGVIARTDLRYRDTPTVVVLYGRTRHEVVPVLKSALHPGQLLDLLATLANLSPVA